MRKIGKTRRSASNRRKSQRQTSLRVEALEERRMLTTPFGALPSDTGEFFLGKVAITPVFFESDGSVMTESQDWTPAQVTETKLKLEEAAAWWETTLGNYTDVHSLEFVFDFTYADTPVTTGYEPIDGNSGAFSDWVDDFLDLAGQNTSASVFDDVNSFNNTQREALDADWAFTIFIADSDEGDGSFASGQFTLAFAYSTSKFIIAPSTRPASTFTHEIGHMFWAHDEYVNGYNNRRGYYNAQNLNAQNNPSGVQEPSIMADGAYFSTALQDNITSQSSREIMGWRDTDGDGVFDVLDVPHTLEATGSYNPDDDSFRLTGAVEVGTLPNLNSSGNQSDITINLIDALEYRIDGGDWLTAQTFSDTYQTNLDATINLSGGTSVEFRTASYDPITDRLVTTSNVFMGGPNSPNTTALPGISGIVFHDPNTNETLEDGENGIPGATVQLTDELGVPLTQDGVEPDDFANGDDISEATDGVRLTAEGWSVFTSLVLARDRDFTSTGDRVFAFLFGPATVGSDWIEDSRDLVINFDQPTTRVAIDAIANSNGDVGRLEAYDSNDNLIGRYTTSALDSGEIETMEVVVDGSDISYAIASGFAATAIRLDNLEYGAAVQTTTDLSGGYRLPGIDTGTHYVQAIVGNELSELLPVVSTGQSVQSADIAVESANAWHNLSMPFDANNDGSVTISDLREVFLELTVFGARELNEPNPSQGRLVDINNDGSFTLSDLRLIFGAFSGTPESEPEGTVASVYADTTALLVGDGESSSWAPWRDSALETASVSTSSFTSTMPPQVASPLEDQVWGAGDFWRDNDSPFEFAPTRPGASRNETQPFWGNLENPGKPGTSRQPAASNWVDDRSVSRWDLIDAERAALDLHNEDGSDEPEQPDSEVTNAPAPQSELPGEEA